MKTKRNNLFFFGMLAAALVFGLVFAACKNAPDDEYHLKWGREDTTYSNIATTIASEGWTVAASDTNWSLATGSSALDGYSWCMGHITWEDGGDFGGSFEDCINFSKNGISAPAGLKTAGNTHKANAPLAGFFDAGNGNEFILFYITKN